MSAKDACLLGSTLQVWQDGGFDRECKGNCDACNWVCTTVKCPDCETILHGFTVTLPDSRQYLVIPEGIDDHTEECDWPIECINELVGNRKFRSALDDDVLIEF